MSIVFMIVFFLVALMIVGLVLLQEGKGGGLTGMSAGMDGVMGAKNPLRRMTAYLFVFFVLMCMGINWYFHESTGTALPQGLTLPVAEAPAPVLPAPASMEGVDADVVEAVEAALAEAAEEAAAAAPAPTPAPAAPEAPAVEAAAPAVPAPAPAVEAPEAEPAPAAAQ